MAKDLLKQDRSGTRRPADVERKYRLGIIDPMEEDVEKLKEMNEVDSFLSTSSVHPVQNKVITNALNGKVTKEDGKGLSTNDFTDTYKDLITSTSGNSHSHTNKSVLDSVTQSVVTSSHTHSNKSVLDSLTQAVITNSHTHSNKSVLDSITQTKINNWDNASSGSNSAIYQEYHTDYAGYVWFNDGLLIQWGRTSVTPTAVNTDTTARITYTYSYDNIPDRKTEISSATPNVANVTSGGGTTTALSKQGMNIYINSTTTKAVTVDWLATGYKSV